MAEPKVVHVEVFGQKYPIKTELDPAYVEQLATFVESRMEMASKSSPSSDAVGLAVLAALNITDEFFRTRTSLANKSGSMTARAEALEKIVDQALALAQ
jgi:cell division protein ZapA